MQVGTLNEVLIPLTSSSDMFLPTITMGFLHLEPLDLYKSTVIMSISL